MGSSLLMSEKSFLSEPMCKGTNQIFAITKDISKAAWVNLYMYSSKDSSSFCLRLNKLRGAGWYLLKLEILCKNNTSNSSIDWIDLGGRVLNHYYTSPTRVVMKTRHLTPCEYWCRRDEFSKRPRCSFGSVVLLYLLIWGRQKWGGSSYFKISLENNI